LRELDLAHGNYDRRADDGFILRDCRVTNAVRCVPPANKPTPDEAKNCRSFLVAEIGAMTQLRGLVALGQIAHVAVVAAHGLRQKDFPFGHGRLHDLGRGRFLADSYHCSRYNTNTGRLTAEMFREVIAAAKARARTAGQP
jgi:uracil-DNA glycosylase